VSLGGYKWYEIDSSTIKVQAFEFLNIFLSVTFLVQVERVMFSVYEESNFFDRQVIQIDGEYSEDFKEANRIF
jgi:hypothetical protein